ncbi:MAG: ABC transporter permease [Elusimicrobia bacterium]|nr:ABC transporter permease [Elusimicrobiota bacterium]
MSLTRLALATSSGLREIRAHKARSVLSFSAVSVGVASLLYTFAQVNGMRVETRRAIDLMGPGRLSIGEKRDYEGKGLSPGLTAHDAEEIGRIPGLFMAYPKAVSRGADVRYAGERFEDVQVIGTTADWAKRDWVYRRRGRFLNAADVRDAARVCVVLEPGGWVHKPFWAVFMGPQSPFESLVQRRDLLGRELRLEGHAFTVVGVLREPPLDQDPRWQRDWGVNGTVLVPVSSFHQHLARPAAERSPAAVDQIEVDTGDESAVAAARRAIETILARRHRGEADYEIRDAREDIQGQLNEVRQYAVMGLALGSVAILAGGIGIMNVTLATIFLRVKEIGIRRALGASRADIVGQFVAEATLLGLLGGVAGVGLGLAGIELLARRADKDLAEPTWVHLVAAMGVAAATGFGFSVVPAWRASALDPVEALRNE